MLVENIYATKVWLVLGVLLLRSGMPLYTHGCTFRRRLAGPQADTPLWDGPEGKATLEHEDLISLS